MGGAREARARRGRELGAGTPLTVLSSTPSISPDELEFEHVKGENAEIEIALERAGAPIGGTIAGTARVTPHTDHEIAAISAFLYRDRRSHPVQKKPAEPSLGWKAKETIAKKPAVTPGAPIELPFKLRVPRDVSPTAVAANSTRGPPLTGRRLNARRETQPSVAFLVARPQRTRQSPQ